jgi:hypothetical protein
MEYTYYDGVGMVVLHYYGERPQIMDEVHPNLTRVTGHYDGDNIYFIAGVPTNRPPQLTQLNKDTLSADGVDTVNVTGTPTGTLSVCNLDTGDSLVGDVTGTAQINSSFPGTIIVRITAWPYLPWEQTIHAI